MKARGWTRAMRWGAMVIVAALAVLAVHWVSIEAFKREMRHATLEMTRREAASTAEALTDALGRLSGEGSDSMLAPEAIRERLEGLLAQHPNVVSAWLVDAHGRIVAVRTLRGRLRGSPPGNILLGGPPRGFHESAVLRALGHQWPTLEHTRIDVLREGRPVGWLRILMDNQSPQATIDAAAARVTARLVGAVAALALVVGVALMVIGRQRRAARRLRAQRDRAESLAHAGALAAGLAHELRNPLNSLGVALQLLEEDLADGVDTRVGPQFERIRDGLARLERTVGEFLTYGAPVEQRPARVSLHETVGGVCAELQTRPDAAELRIEPFVDDTLAVWCDPLAARQILDNVIGNAARVAREGDRPACIRIRAARVGRRAVEVVVDDTGPGVAPEVGERVFECFYSERKEGSGLGLPIARRLAELNGGALELDPTPSPLGGARFRLTLPNAERGIRNAK